VLGSFKQVVADGDNPILIVPLDHSVTRLYPVADREVLYARSLQYIFNGAVVTHLRWYQTEAFADVVLVVAIIITIYSWGSQAWTIGAALAAGAYGLAAYLVLEMVIEYLVLRLLYKTVVRVLGAKFALVLAIVAAVAGISEGLTSEAGVQGAPWAAQLLQVSTGLTSAIANKYKVDVNNLLGEEKDLLAKEEKQTEILQSAQELLNNNIHLDPFVIFGETPQNYYNRTIHSGNIGINSVDAISVYVDGALALPTLQDSFGGPHV
jgi:hypothetical protein